MDKLRRSLRLAFIVVLGATLSLVVFSTSRGQGTLGTFQSDDFNACTIDSSLWSFVDPVGDGSATVNGSQLLLSVPAGASHDVWSGGNMAPRVMQATSDGDFEVEVKFESGVEQAYQLQGIVVEQDANNFLRFDFYSDGGSTRLFAASFSNGSPAVHFNNQVAGNGASPLFMRIGRVGDAWTQSYSTDGQTWNSGASFSHSLAVAQVGVFAGNAGGNPAHTAVVDYFFNTAAPISPEDGQSFAHTLTVDVVGGGSVTRSPEQATYGCNEVVELTAVAPAGWAFSGWSGDLSGSENPASLTMDGNKAVTATFVESVDTAPPSIANIEVFPNGTEATISWQTDEPASSSVAYGQTPSYESGTVGDAAFATQHQVLLAGLAVDAVYYFEVTSADTSGNASSSGQLSFVATSGGPVIDIWYGSTQQFGHIGNPQQWVNILGDVSDPDGVASLSYSLNQGAAVPLSIGPDTRRLASPGDFNIDIDRAALAPGMNEVLVTATDSVGNVSTQTVTVDYASGNVWPLPYTIDWSTVGNMQDVAQVVDGFWGVTPDGLRALVPEYDRTVAIGDIAWTDYEVTVPITIHSINAGGFDYPSNGPGVGLLLHWLGHTDSPVSGWQPKSGWSPFGAIGWWRWSSLDSARLEFMDKTSISSTPQLGVRYMMKVRVEAGGNGPLYQLKAWQDGQPEPAQWDLSYQASSSNLDHGSLLLLAHEVDATFGNVSVTPLSTAANYTLTTATSGSGAIDVDPLQSSYASGEVVTLTAAPSAGWTFVGWSGDLSGSENPASLTMDGNKAVTATFVESADTTPPVIGNVQVATTETSATISWTTDEGATSEVAYGPTEAYEGGTVGDATLVTQHAVTLSGLSAGTTYHYQVRSADGNGNAASTADATFTTSSAPPASSLVSDDFNACTIDSGLWSFVDPVGDGSATVNGSQLLLSVPAGTSHDVWSGGNMAARVMQAASDGDFEVEVKFESGVEQGYQLQGIVVEQDANNFLRFDFYSDGGSTRLFAASFVNGGPTIQYNNSIASGGASPLYMRIGRVGDAWTQSYSTDGQTWNSGASFGHAMTVGQVGVFAGNAGGNPAHTAVVDYFFNTAAPISPEDGQSLAHTLTVDVVGGGSVTRSPEQATYGCNEVVELTAVAPAGWAFSGWSGDLSGSENPASLTMDGNKAVTATFVESVDTTPPVIGNVQVATTETSATISWTTDEGATSEVAYGPTEAYEGGTVGDAALVTQHAVTLSGLSAETTYHYQVRSADGNGNAASTADATFTTNSAPPASSLVSDHFSGDSLDNTVWSFVDPVGDSSASVVSGRLLLSVPAGASHDVWSGGNMAPRVMQAASDGDFEVEVKFESGVEQAYQLQGVVVEQDAGNFMRFDFYSDGGSTRLFAASFSNGSPTVHLNRQISGSGAAPLYMRVGRVGDAWTQSYSTDGQTWNSGASFSHSLAVAQVGVFAGNAGGNPAHTAVVDYFFNTAAPVEGTTTTFFPQVRRERRT